MQKTYRQMGIDYVKSLRKQTNHVKSPTFELTGRGKGD